MEDGVSEVIVGTFFFIDWRLVILCVRGIMCAFHSNYLASVPRSEESDDKVRVLAAHWHALTLAFRIFLNFILFYFLIGKKNLFVVWTTVLSLWFSFFFVFWVRNLLNCPPIQVSQHFVGYFWNILDRWDLAEFMWDLDGGTWSVGLGGTWDLNVGGTWWDFKVGLVWDLVGLMWDLCGTYVGLGVWGGTYVGLGGTWDLNVHGTCVCGTWWDLVGLVRVEPMTSGCLAIISEMKRELGSADAAPVPAINEEVCRWARPSSSSSSSGRWPLQIQFLHFFLFFYFQRKKIVGF